MRIPYHRHASLAQARRAHWMQQPAEPVACALALAIAAEQPRRDPGPMPIPQPPAPLDAYLRGKEDWDIGI